MKPNHNKPHLTVMDMANSSVPEIRQIAQSLIDGEETHPFAVDDFEAIAVPKPVISQTTIEAAASRAILWATGKPQLS